MVSLWEQVKKLLAWNTEQRREEETAGATHPALQEIPSTNTAAEPLRTEAAPHPESAAASAQQSPSSKGKAPEYDDPDDLDTLFHQAWDEVDKMTAGGNNETFPWSKNNASQGVSPGTTAGVFDAQGMSYSSEPLSESPDQTRSK